MQKFDQIKDLIRYLNGYRLANKNTWFNGSVLFKGEPFSIKFYGTWSQVMTYKDFRHSGAHDLNVTQWRKEIIDFLDK